MGSAIKLIVKGKLTPARLKAIRVLCKETIAGISTKTGFSKGFIKKIEQGKINPVSEHVEVLLKAIGAKAENPIIYWDPWEARVPFIKANFKKLDSR